jgi:LmbE family N-acetylglucosaminyl deacetylase
MRAYLSDNCYENGHYRLGIIAHSDEEAIEIAGTIDNPGASTVHLHYVCSNDGNNPTCA